MTPDERFAQLREAVRAYDRKLKRTGADLLPGERPWVEDERELDQLYLAMLRAADIEPTPAGPGEDRR